MWRLVLLCTLLTCLLGPPSADAAAPQADALPLQSPRVGMSNQVFLPVLGVGAAGCAPVHGGGYELLPIVGPPADRPAEQHADLNLALRGYVTTSAYLALIQIDGPTDASAPQLATLFADRRAPGFAGVYQAYHWDWVANERTVPIRDPWVTLGGLTSVPGEIVYLPDSGYTIGDGFEALVLYASEDRLTVKYTREDSVVHGYTIHLEDICVEPTLLALYRSSDLAGRGRLPALRAGQPLGRARGSELRIAVRDSGRFLDPRSRKDWWRDYAPMD